MARKEIVAEITAEIYETTGTYWVSIHQLARKYLHVDDSAARALLQGLHCVKDGRAYRFRAKDIAERIVDRRELYGEMKTSRV